MQFTEQELAAIAEALNIALKLGVHEEIRMNILGYPLCAERLMKLRADVMPALHARIDAHLTGKETTNESNL